jgi:hypothetical protein
MQPPRPTLAQAQARAGQLFTKPGLADRVRSVQEQYFDEGSDTYTLSGLIKDALHEQQEYEFEQSILPYPLVVKIPREVFVGNRYAGKGSEPSSLFNKAEAWLGAHVPADEYLAFPGTAAGKYKDCVFNVYFKTHQWATFFKVGFIY